MINIAEEKRYFLETLTHDPTRPIDDHYKGVSTERGTYDTLEEAKRSAEILNMLCTRKVGSKFKPIEWKPGLKAAVGSVASAYILYGTHYEVVFYITDLYIVREDIKREAKERKKK